MKNSQDIDIEETLDKIIKRVTVKNEELENAKEKWIIYRKIHDKSNFEISDLQLDKKAARELHDKIYLGTLRLIEECSKLQEHIRQFKKSKIKGNIRTNISLTLDADLYKNFAQIDKSSNYAFRGIHFLKDKIISIQNFDQDNYDHGLEKSYFIALLSEIFRLSKPLALTNAGKVELSNYPNILLRLEEDSPEVDYQYERLETGAKNAITLTKQIESALNRIDTIANIFKLNEEEKAEKTHRAYNDIVSSVSVPSAINNYILARLNSALRFSKGQLGNVEKTIAKNLRDAGCNIDAHDFLYVMNNLKQSRQPELNAAKRSIEGAYKTYQKVYFNNDNKISYGAIENISALFEVHLANCVLNQLGIDHEIHYVHKNDLVFGFLRGFPRGKISVPSIHPRFTFFYARPSILFQQLKDGKHSLSPAEHLQIASVLVSSFETRMQRDGQISAEEYQIFSRNIQTILNQIQEVHVSLLIDAGEFEKENETRHQQAKAAKEGLEYYFSTILAKSEQYQIEWPLKNFNNNKIENIAIFQQSIKKCMSLLLNIEPQLENSLLLTKVALVDQVKDKQLYRNNSAFSASSLEQVDEILTSLNNISKISMKDECAEMFISFYKPITEQKIIRINCVPLVGGYRYLFVLHSKELAEFLNKTLSLTHNRIEIHNFCESAINFCDKEISKPKVSGLIRTKFLVNKYIISGFQGAALRNWGLAQTLAEIALAYIDDFIEKSKITAADGELLAQKVECFSLLQITQRALSEETHSKKRKKQSLIGAVSSLSKGLETLIQIPPNTIQIIPPLLPHAIRLYLARVSTELERDINIHRGYLDDSVVLDWSAWFEVEAPYLPNVNKEILGLLANGKGGLALEDKYSYLKKIATSVLSQVLVACSQVKNGANNGHGLQMWDYLSLRAAQTLDMVNVTEFLLVNDPNKNLCNYSEYSHNMHPELLVILKRYIESAGFSITANNTPIGLMAAIKFYYAVAEEMQEDPGVIPDRSRKSHLKKLELACSKLVQTGIPRYVTNQLKNKLKDECEDRRKLQNVKN